MRYGVEFVPYRSLEVLVELAKRAEGLNLDYIWVCDHYHGRHVHSVLAVLAQATKRVKLGPGVTNPYLIHPAVTAAAIATLQELSRGRAVLGISAGDPFFLSTVGVRFRKPVLVVKEAIQVIRRLLRGGKVRFKGETLECSGARLRFKPPDPVPIYVGGRKKRMLELAGEVADGALINASHPEDLKECLTYIQAGIRSKGRGRRSFDLVAYTCVSAHPNPARARKVARGVVAFVASSAPAVGLEKHGISEAKVERIRRKLQAGDIEGAAKLVDERMLDAFSISGTPREVVDRFEELEEIGITQIVVGSPIGPKPLQALSSIGRLLSKSRG